jgi:predicted ATPase
MSNTNTKRPWIRELRLKRFRAFENARLGLCNFTVIVGRNGSGKTTLLEAFDFLQDSMVHSLGVALERRGGIGSIIHRPSDRSQADYTNEKSRERELHSRAPNTKTGFEIAINIVLPTTEVLYGFSVGPTRANRAGFRVRKEVLRTYPKASFSFERTGEVLKTELKHVRPVVSPEALLLPVIAEQERVWKEVLECLRELLVYDFSPQVMQVEPRIGSQLWLARDGSNIGDVLRRIEDDESVMQWIVNHLDVVTPGIRDIRSGASAGRRTINFYQETGEKTCRFSSLEMSSGTLHALGVLVALRQEPKPTLVFIDEIETSIHTLALSALMDAASATSEERCQVIVSSHSTDALSHPSVTAENVRIVDWQGTKSVIFRIAKKVKESLEPPENVGRLLRTNSLWPDNNAEIIGEDIFEVGGTDVGTL